MKEHVECQFCGHKTTKACLGRHLSCHHQKTIRDNTLLRLSLSEEQIPICPYCKNKPVKVGHDLEPTCGSEECHQQWYKERRTEIAKLGAATQLARGIHPFSKENLKIDTDGKSIMHSQNAVKANHTRVTNGTHPFQHQNLELDECGKSILHVTGQNIRVQNGNHPWSSQNLKRDEEGRSVLHQKIAARRKENGEN